MKRLTACEVESVELSDYEQLTAVLLEGQVAEPLEDHRHLEGAPFGGRGEGGLPVACGSWQWHL